MIEKYIKKMMIDEQNEKYIKEKTINNEKVQLINKELFEKCKGFINRFNKLVEV